MSGSCLPLLPRTLVSTTAISQHGNHVYAYQGTTAGHSTPVCEQIRIERDQRWQRLNWSSECEGPPAGLLWPVQGR